MGKVRQKDTEPEMLVRRFLFSKGFRYRIHDSRYPGSPDIILPKYKTVIFINGCFWHCHLGCRAAKLPETNPEFWQAKLKRNAERDSKINKELEKSNWKVLIVWECEVKGKNKRQIRLENLIEEILS